MATKTITGNVDIELAGEVLTFKLAAIGSNTVVNGSGDNATIGALGGFSFDVTENLSGWFNVFAFDSAGESATVPGRLFLPGDIPGTYYVDDPALTSANHAQQIGPLYRPPEDVNPITFLWPAPGDNGITGTVIKTQGGVVGGSQAIQGAIAPTGVSVVVNNVTMYEYRLTRHPDDRPTDKGSARYELTGTVQVNNATPSGILYLEVGAIGSSPSVAVLPGRDRGLPQSPRGRIVVSQGELITIARQVVDGNGNAVNLTGKTLQFIIQDARGVDVAVIPDNDITVSGTNSDTYSFTMTSASSARAGNFNYWLNDVGSSKAELAKGDWIVEPRPLADS